MLVELRLRARRFERLAARFEDELAACENRVAEGRADAGPGPSCESLLAGLSRLPAWKVRRHHMGRIAADPDADLRGARYARPGGVRRQVGAVAPAGDDHSPILSAFFAYLVRRWYRAKPAANSIIYCPARLMGQFRSPCVKTPSRPWRMWATAPFAHALEAPGWPGRGHSPRLVTETLLASTCKTRTSSPRQARRAPGGLHPQTASAVINYLRMKSAGSPKHLLVLSGRRAPDREVRLACVRYFMRNPHPCARPSSRGSRAPTPRRGSSSPSPPWRSPPTPGRNHRGSCSMALLSSRNWFVRFNSAKSLQ